MQGSPWISLLVALCETSFFWSEYPEPSHQRKTQNRSKEEKTLHDGALKQSGQRQNQQSRGWQQRRPKPDRALAGQKPFRQAKHQQGVNRPPRGPRDGRALD